MIRKYSDQDISEYVKGINDVCYEIFNKYVSISKVTRMVLLNHLKGIKRRFYEMQ